MEGLNKIKGGQLVELSVQELLDCSSLPWDSPCERGSPSHALYYVKNYGGLLTEAEYPYVAKKGPCLSREKHGPRIGKITGDKDVVPRTEQALALAVLKAPVAVSIDASGPTMQSYRSGVYKGPCNTTHNHAMAVVGYGVDAAGVEYWIAKNSWGQTWGQKGFAFIRRGADGSKGLCGIAEWNVYPVKD